MADRRCSDVDVFLLYYVAYYYFNECIIFNEEQLTTDMMHCVYMSAYSIRHEDAR
jgi:hypothetical protein